MGEVVELFPDHDLCTTCSECGHAEWFIVWKRDKSNVKEIVCGKCFFIIENPALSDEPIAFEMDYTEFRAITDIEFEYPDDV